ncbi:MAG: hypothetical protein K2N56_08120 [Oscillospiraceae bacterium]|nr:hypothetical protein [Oscillospiraceae bacterium]
MIAKLNADMQLYRALSTGDLPGAYLINCSIDKDKTCSIENPATAFNKGLCLFLLEEYEAALSELKHAEQLSGNPPEIDISERKLFNKAIELSNYEQSLAVRPLDPGSVTIYARYVLVRTKWLTAFCLKALGRDGEASMIKRFLSQYNIEI